MNICFVARDAKLPIVLVSKLRGGCFKFVLAQCNIHIEKDGLRDDIIEGVTCSG